jgi:secondary thiamine-phosphate synthase enzyme
MFQKSITLTRRNRGFHLVTDEILLQLSELKNYSIGLAHFFLQHTSASISINENADPTVLKDMERHVNVMVPENSSYFEHLDEGPDDMPAHIKSSLIGCEITIPISKGQLALGTWQGIYLGEHRNQAGSRNIIVTLIGEE